MKLYLVDAYGEQVNFDSFVVDENGLETFKSRMETAIKEKRFDGDDLWTEVHDDKIEIENYTIFWKEIKIISDFPEIDSIKYSDEGSDQQYLTINDQ